MDHRKTAEQARAGLPDVSPNVSVFWKPLHRLFQDGNPIDPVTMLYYDLGPEKRLPFAAISKTKGNRLILWPPTDALEQGDFADGSTFAVHHVTLELSNNTTHFTRFDTTGQRIHEKRLWKLDKGDSGLMLWLIAAFRISLLEQQVGALEQSVMMPPSDNKRRNDEFRRYVAKMKSVFINTPPLRGDCFITAIHVLPGEESFRGPVLPDYFPRGRFWNDWIDGWPDGDIFQVAPTPINVDGVNLLLLTASPSGSLKGACFLGGPSSRSEST